MLTNIEEIGDVTFPEFTAERIYMLPFLQNEGLPKHVERWQATVDAMLGGIKTDKPIYLMVDQAEVKSGNTHRRPGVHIDGYWIPSLSCHWGDPGGNHGFPTSPGHHGIPTEPSPSGNHEHGTPGRHGNNGRHGNSGHAFGRINEALILASDIAACKAYVGEVEGEPSEGGDCSHMNLKGIHTKLLKANVAYAGSALDLLHESIPVSYDCQRTVVRLNIRS